jgi:putative ABC transport system substrate-binding protein
MNRREFIAGIGSAAAWPLMAWAQQRTLPVIGILGAETERASAGRLSAFMQGLKDTGFVEGQNIAIQAHWANDQYDRLPAMAAELVRARVALIFAVGNNLTTRAAKNATSTIPIVSAADFFNSIGQNRPLRSTLLCLLTPDADMVREKSPLGRPRNSA